MKQIVIAALLLFSVKAKAQHTLTKLWATDAVLPVPESVLFDGAGKLLYVSLIDGENNKKDGKGEIARLGLDGKIINGAWVSGLNAPKGMGRYKNLLYVADLDEIAVIDIPSAKIQKRIPVEGAKFLNDVTVDENGTVYVSDTETGKVHQLKAGEVSTYLSGLKGPNGLLAQKGKLYVLASGELLEVGADKKTTVLASGLNPSTDGIEAIDGHSFIVSSWEGVIYYVPKKGAYQQLLDVRAGKINTADIGYDAVKKIVYVPTFFKNNVVAYQLK
jgi:hypothetical protein